MRVKRGIYGLMAPLTAAGALVGGGGIAHAATATAAAAQEGVTIEDVVVTARRREETGQSTPVSVTAVTPVVLERANIQRPSGLSRIVAGLITQPNTSFDAGFSAFIRGIGSSESALTLDTPVGVYRDGVYLGKSTVAGNTDFTTLERVEVLRGPQGTLFGRNTTGGAINFVTRNPRETFGLSQQLRYGRFSELESTTTIDTGQFGGLSAVATYQHRQRHGYVDDPNANGFHDPGSVKADTFFGKVRGEWGNFTAAYVFDWYKSATISPQFQLTAGNPTFLAYYGASPGLGGAALPLSPDRLGTINIVNQPLQHNKTWGHALTLEYKVDDRLTLKSITGYRKYDAPELFFTITPEGLRGRLVTAPTVVQTVGLYTTGPKNQQQEQFTQELQALGDIGPVNYTVGAFHFRETGSEFNRGTLVAVISPQQGFPTTTTSNYYVHNNSDALYGQLNYKPEFLQGFELSGGVRYSKDIRRVTQLAAAVRAGRVSFENVTYMVSAKMQWTPNVMTFARIGTAVRSGGFNIRAGAGQDFVFKPEKATSYEAGIKSQIFDNRLRLNAGVFYTKYTDLQVTTITGVAAGGSGLGGQTFNADATYRGFEAELLAKPIREVTITANVGYVDPKYKRIFFLNPATGLPQNYASTSRFPYVPKWNGSVDAIYSKEVGLGTASLDVNYSYVGKRWFGINNLPTQNPLNEQLVSKAYGIVNARASLADIAVGPRVKMEVALWVDNLTNKYYRATGIDFGSLGFGGNVFGPPRTYGVDLKFDY